MPLHNPVPVPERILAFGPAGSGKTSNLLHVAKMLKLSGSDAQVHIGDSDYALPRMLVGQYSDLDNVHFHPLIKWSDYEALAAIAPKLRPQDWLGIDVIGSAWTEVQDHFAREVFNDSIANYFLDVRKQQGRDAGKSLGALEGWTDWQVINAMYRQWITDCLFRIHANVYATAKSDNLSNPNKPTEDITTRQMFARFDQKPIGQKDLPFQFHTVLFVTRDPRGNFIINTIKDRERTELRGATVSNFVTDYLVKIAGWKLA
jgi:hypothetical protein